MVADATQDILEHAKPSYREAAIFKTAGIFLNQIVRDARLTVLCPAYDLHLTAGHKGTESFTITVAHPRTLWELVTNPDPGAGDMYMNGDWDMQDGDLGAFLSMMARNLQNIFNSPAGFVLNSVLKKKMNERSWDIQNSRDNVQRHYDLGNDLYQSFLDSGMNYSCAFFTDPDMNLRDAQLNKLRTTFQRLDIQPGMDVLDIGCGWGEATRVIADETGAHSVTGITLARNQWAVAQERAKNMARAPAYILEDYREHAASHQGAYDRIVSIGMFEHVGEKNYPAYFAAVRDQLKPGGKALIHSIMNATRSGRGMINGPWLERHIFPAGRIPDLPEMLDAAYDAGLRPLYPIHLQPPSDYAQTLRLWRKNFLANIDNLDPQKYDATFRRMWVFYLAMCEAMFDGCGFQVGQVVFEKRN